MPVVLPPETNAARSLDPLYYWPPQPANRHFRMHTFVIYLFRFNFFFIFFSFKGYEITMEMIAQAREYAGYGNSNWGMGRKYMFAFEIIASSLYWRFFDFFTFCAILMHKIFTRFFACVHFYSIKFSSIL